MKLSVMVFSDPADLDAFFVAVEDHAEAPALVLRVAQRRALAALHASGATHIKVDELRSPAARRGLDVLQDALVDLAYRCGQHEPMTPEDIGRLRIAALTACAWQEYAPGAKTRRRLTDLLPDAVAGRKREAKEKRQDRDGHVRSLQRDADTLRKNDPARPVADIRATLEKIPGVTGRMVRDVKVARPRKNLSRPKESR